ncbi:hypothetical protein [Arthrobacter sp. USHLN218]|uniref:hypothetical protein n=1 Tax=Arthrobacter sp. USHLN218 TaxID=3081232 RepID=UPI0030182F52
MPQINASHEPQLLKNALDFITRAVEEVSVDSGQSEEENKYAVLYMASGIEVLLKARLIREHWSLVFEDPGRANLANFHSGNFISVQVSKAGKRLNDISGLQLELDQIDRVFQLRNRIVHFAPAAEEEAVRVILARALSFVTNFIENQLKPHVQQEDLPSVEQAQARIRFTFSELRDFAEKRMMLLRDGDLRGEVVLECPRCTQPALVTGLGNDPKCFFCHYALPATEMAHEYLSQVAHFDFYYEIKSGGDAPIYNCPECDMPSSLVGQVTVVGQPDVDLVCFSCGHTFTEEELTACERCGSRIYSAEDDWRICADCESYGFG